MFGALVRRCQRGLTGGTRQLLEQGDLTGGVNIEAAVAELPGALLVLTAGEADQADAIAQAAPAFAQEIAGQAEVAGEVLVGIELGEIPARGIDVDAVLEGRVVAHLARQGSERVADALLLFDIDIEIAHLVKTDHVVLAVRAALAIAVVDEHLGDGGLAARDQM